MPWMCLERCGDTTQDIETQLINIHNHLDLVTGVSFEKYNLGPNGQLVKNNFTQVYNILKSWGLETFPMVSSYPYPPQFLDWMRAVFNNPNPFITEALKEADIYKYTGFNLDWEPTTEGTPADAINYAKFLSTFADSLHKTGRILTVDVAGWNSIWNYSLISNSRVDRMFTMDTYVTNFTVWERVFLDAHKFCNIRKLGIGLETVRSNDEPYSVQELKERFDMVKKYKIQEIDIWRTDIPENWWHFIAAFVYGR